MAILAADWPPCVGEVWRGCGHVPLGSGVVARGDMCELCCLCLHGNGSDGQGAHWNGSRLVLDTSGGDAHVYIQA